MIAQILEEEILADCSQNRQSAKISGHTVSPHWYPVTPKKLGFNLYLSPSATKYADRPAHKMQVPDLAVSYVLYLSVVTTCTVQ